MGFPEERKNPHVQSFVVATDQVRLAHSRYAACGVISADYVGRCISAVASSVPQIYDHELRPGRTFMQADAQLR